jgi:nitroreductase
VTSAVRETFPAYYDDFRRYLRHSSSTGPYRSRPNLQGKITATYHNLEKGLSLPAPRPGFGAPKVANLVGLVKAYLKTFGMDEWITIPIAVLGAYRAFNIDAGVESPSDADIVALVDQAAAAYPDAVPAGIRSVHRADLERAVESVGLEFFSSRSTVRQYSDEPVDPADIEFAAAAAQRAPAVCNRQFGRLYVYTERADIDRILELQGGARGFGDQLRGLAIVTTDLRNFWAAGERHQAWTDGGLFAMSFVLGLHARGLGTVCLNWSKTPRTDQKLREIANLPEESVVIMLVGFGHLRESYSVASSIRVPLSEVLELR